MPKKLKKNLHLQRPLLCFGANTLITRALLHILISVSFSNFCFSQKVFNGSLTLKTQEELNAFASDAYEEIQGDLSIEYLIQFSSLKDPIVSLANLSHLNKIHGSLSIKPTILLTNLQGLENLTSIGKNLTIKGTGLENLEGLSSLKNIQGYFTIERNIKLVSLKGLEHISEIGNVYIHGNSQLEEINSFDSVFQINGSLTISDNRSLKNIGSFEKLNYLKRIAIGENENLKYISDFSNLLNAIDDLEIYNNSSLEYLPRLPLVDSIAFNLDVFNNSSLLDLNSLSTLTYVSTLSINNNIKITSLSGLENLTKIANLYVFNNTNLSTCCLPIDFRELVSYTVSIHSNALGCLSIEDVLANCSYQNICGFYSIPEWSESAFNTLCETNILSGIPEEFRNASKPITRAELATIVFNAIGLHEDKDFASDFPSPFGDLQGHELWYHKYAKNLLYLEYGDGQTPFDKNRFNFFPDSLITKAHATKVLIEAWNLEIMNGSLSYTDVDTGHEVYDYLVTAEQNKFFQNAPYTDVFNPNEAITWAEISLFIYNALQEKDKPTIIEEDFFIPGNITPLTLSSPPSLSEGYFDYSGGVSFAIPDIGLPMVFAHSYNSFYHELPSQLNTGVNNSQTPLKPLGSGWSHSFNAYMLKLEGQEEQENWAVVWPDGAFHFYQEDNEGYSAQTLGVYDTLIRDSDTKFRVTTKGQINYIFEKIPGSLDAFPFVLTQITDRNNHTLSITYTLSENNGWYRISEVKGTTGRKLRFSYESGSDLISSITDPSGRIIRFEYDSKDNARANLIKYTDVKGNAETYDYTDLNGFKFLSKITFPDGNEIINDYDPLLRKLKSTENKYAKSKLTFTHHFGYSEAEGDFNYSDFEDENNLNYTARRNIAGRLTEFQSQIGLSTTKYEGGSVILPSSITGIDNVEAEYEYDSRANVTKIGLPTGIEHTFAYNDLNDVLSYTDPLGNTTSYQYDNAGNLESIITAEGGETSFERLNNGLLKSVTSPEGITIRFDYDGNGNLIKTEAPEGIVTEAVFDILGRVEKQFNNSGQEYLFEYDKYDNTIATIDPLGYKTRYQFDQTTNDLDAIVNAKNKATNLTYDNQNRLTKEEFEGNATSYDFDDLGFLDTYTDPSGHQFKMVYDDFRRLEDNGYSQITYDEKNNIETVKSPEGKTITYSYDNVLNRIKAISYEGETIGYEYDQIGNLTKLIYPDGKEVTYKYDKENRLKEVIDWADNSTTYTYLKDGRLATMTYPNQIMNVYHYDNAGRSLGFEAQKSHGSKFYSYSYVLDPTGKHIQEDYDGEIDQQFQQEEASISYQYNSANRIQKAGETTFDFDVNGNTIRKGNTTFSYDLWNNLTHLSNPDTDTEISYTYDGLGNRRSKTENGQTTQYSLDILGMSRVLVEHLQDDKKNFYVYGLGLISRLDEDENASFYHYDFRGSTIALTDKDETVTHSYIYDVFGETLSSTEADYNSFRFVGKYGVMHEADDFYFMRARYYDASIGRFLSEDPIWSANLYVYGNNDPVNNFDPNGESSINIMGELQGFIFDPLYLEKKALQTYNQVYDFTTQLGAGACAGYAEGYLNSTSTNDRLWNRVSGGFSCLWTPESAWKTELVLSGGSASLIKGAAKATAQSFMSFSAFKRALGQAGKGKHWHHIVAQHTDNLARFGKEAIHNTANIISIPGGFKGSLHSKITGHYNSLMPGTKMLVRDYVKTLSYDQQYQYGIKILKQFGWKP